MNKRIISILLAGTVAAASVPASAQLLGGVSGGLGGNVGGMLDSRPGSTAGSLGGAFEGHGNADAQTEGLRNGVGKVRDKTQQKAAEGAATTRATAQGAKQKTSEAAQSEQSLDTGWNGTFEKRAAGRNVKANGSSSQSVKRDASGLSLGNANAADASITKIERQPVDAPPATEPAAAKGE
jgi:hypothetical protein